MLYVGGLLSKFSDFYLGSDFMSKLFERLLSANFRFGRMRLCDNNKK